MRKSTNEIKERLNEVVAQQTAVRVKRPRVGIIFIGVKKVK